MENEVCYTFCHSEPLPAVRRVCGERLDVRDRHAVRALTEGFRPDVIIHAAGSDVSPDSDAVIRQGTENIVRAARSLSARLIHLSTDVIFDGRRAPYDEAAPPSPLHAYGRAKAAAEEAVGDHADHVIVRTSLIYGLDIMDRATTRLVEGLQAGRPMLLFTDQRRNPVWTDTLSSACVELAGADYRGVLNVAGSQVLTRSELGVRMLDWWGVTTREGLTVGLSDGDRWPQNCELDLTRARQLLSTPLPGVDEVMRRCQVKQSKQSCQCWKTGRERLQQI
jgi:dTDP-4-dehydrorhamnose reductase